MNPNDADGNLKYFQDAKIKGAKIRAYMYIGSKCITLRENEARNLELEIRKLDEPCTIGGYGAGKVNVMRLFGVKLVIDKAKAMVPVYIVPGVAQEIPLIVGQPLTELPDVTIIKRKNYIRVFQESGKVEDDLEPFRFSNSFST